MAVDDRGRTGGGCGRVEEAGKGRDGGGSDVFVHKNDLHGTFINEGDRVEFEIGEGRKGPAAQDVRKLTD